LKRKEAFLFLFSYYKRIWILRSKQKKKKERERERERERDSRILDKEMGIDSTLLMDEHLLGLELVQLQLDLVGHRWR
jgi:hypothetical protein